MLDYPVRTGKRRCFFPGAVCWNIRFASLDNLALGKPILSCKQELTGHVERVFRADFITLAAEDALGHPNPYPLGVRQELDRVGRADPDTHLAPDAGIPIVHDLPPELWRGLDRRGDGR